MLKTELYYFEIVWSYMSESQEGKARLEDELLPAHRLTKQPVIEN